MIQSPLDLAGDRLYGYEKKVCDDAASTLRKAHARERDALRAEDADDALLEVIDALTQLAAPIVVRRPE